MACYISALSGSCHASEPGVVVKTFSIAHANSISVFTYGVDSNKIDYLVLEVGRNKVKTQIEGVLKLQNDGNLKGVQYLGLEGMRVRLTSSHRVFIVDQHKCVTMPLTLSLKLVEQSLKDRPQEFSEELLAGLKMEPQGGSQ